MDEDLNQFTPEQVEAIEKIMLEEDRLGYGQATASTHMQVTWTGVANATGYQVFRTPVSDNGWLAELFARHRALQKQLNKRKRQARARTGRRK